MYMYSVSGYAILLIGLPERALAWFIYKLGNSYNAIVHVTALNIQVHVHVQ
jgi:hypothetical protein